LKDKSVSSFTPIRGVNPKALSFLRYLQIGNIATWWLVCHDQSQKSGGEQQCDDFIEFRQVGIPEFLSVQIRIDALGLFQSGRK